MNGPPLVRRAREDEAASVAAVLTDAFVDEAGLNYWLRQGGAKERARRLFFDAAVRGIVHKQRLLWLAEGERAPMGAAIWLDPGCKAFDFSVLQQVAMVPLLYQVAGMAGALRGLDLGEKLAVHHPHEPHAHLVFLGVAPKAQGQGIGSAILKATLAPLDANGIAGYLEATTERNVALYRRHGFEVSGEIDLPGLHLWCMTRPPQR